MPYLELRHKQSGEVARFPLDRSKYLHIGRGAGNDIQLDDDFVSMRHARVEFNVSAWSIRDLRSTNGVLVNGVRLGGGEALELTNGARIECGTTKIDLVFLDTEPGPSQAKDDNASRSAEPTHPSASPSHLVSKQDPTPAPDANFANAGHVAETGKMTGRPESTSTADALLIQRLEMEVRRLQDAAADFQEEAERAWASSRRAAQGSQPGANSDGASPDASSMNADEPSHKPHDGAGSAQSEAPPPADTEGELEAARNRIRVLEDNARRLLDARGRPESVAVGVRIQEELTRLKNELHSRSVKITELEAREGALKYDKETIELLVKDAIAEREKALTQLSERDARIEKFHKIIEDNQAHVARLTAERDSLQTSLELSCMRERDSKPTDELASLRNHSQKLAQERDKARSDVISAREELQQLRRQYEHYSRTGAPIADEIIDIEHNPAYQNLRAEFERVKLELSDPRSKAINARVLEILQAFLPIAIFAQELTSQGPNLHAKVLRTSIEEIRERVSAFQRTQGLRPFDAEGEQFQEERHEEVDFQLVETAQDGLVLETQSPGFLWNGEVIRRARVKVGRKRSGA